ncbi:MAG TPA: phosphoribosyl-ATP diphosphatase [Woeseiaceae bacterium]|nr:phosphoribosyl-ATP diphosphatase [Woeseiaceae bacterium]
MENDSASPVASIAFLTVLEDTIRQRIQEPSPDSYVASLVAAGDKRLAQKLGEEAVELALAAVAGDQAEQLEEAADLLFHLLVLLNAKRMSLADVTAKLEQRHLSRER